MFFKYNCDITRRSDKSLRFFFFFVVKYLTCRLEGCIMIGKGLISMISPAFIEKDAKLGERYVSRLDYSIGSVRPHVWFFDRVRVAAHFLENGIHLRHFAG